MSMRCRKLFLGGYSLLNLCIYKNNPLKIRGVLGKTYNFAATTNKKETLYV
jgi:hypothetical protein